MKQRIITGLLGLALFFLIMFFYDSMIFNVLLCAVALIAVHELLLAIKATKSIPLTALSLVISVVPFILVGTKFDIRTSMIIKEMTPVVIFVLAVIFFAILIINYKTLSFQTATTAIFISIVIPIAFSTLLALRSQLGQNVGLYVTLIIFACAWGSDTGAYFAGKFLGKHKLAPNISPNKTIEGVVGGIFSCYFFVTAVTVIFYFVMKNMYETTYVFNIWAIIIISFIASLIGVFGDLCASMIKRHCEIKDFGSILPGHGGIMDRFDSMLLIAPFIYAVTQLVRIVY